MPLNSSSIKAGLCRGVKAVSEARIDCKLVLFKVLELIDFHLVLR